VVRKALSDGIQPESLLREEGRRGYGATLRRVQVSFAEYFHEIHRYTATSDLCNVSYRERVIKCEINTLATIPTQLHFSPVQQHSTYLSIFGTFSSSHSVVLFTFFRLDLIFFLWRYGPNLCFGLPP
jgi:hypothetical protein